MTFKSPLRTLFPGMRAQREAAMGTLWRLVLNERFSTLDHSIWSRTEKASAGSSYLRPEHVVVAGDQVRLEVDDDAYGGESYTSGEITSRYKFEFKYGLIQARVKYAKGQGLWGAFWPFEGNVTPYEIDISEYLGRLPNRMYFVYHWEDAGHRAHQTHWDGPDFSADYHIYSALWNPTEIVFFVDGVQHHRVANDFIYDDYMYLRLIFFTGEDDGWAGLPDGTTPFPSYTYCDWIRVYQREVDYVVRNIIRDVSFESGNLSGTDDSFDLLVGGEDLAVNNAAALAGSINGLQITLDDVDSHYGRLDLANEKPFLGKYLRLRAYVDPNTLTMSEGDSIKICRVLSSLAWSDYFNVSLRYNSGSYELQYVGNDDSIGWDRVHVVSISNGPHYFEIACVRAESDVSADGSLMYLLDGVELASWVGEDNYNIFSGSSYVGMGALGNADGASGAFYMDELKVSVLNGEIGA